MVTWKKTDRKGSREKLREWSLVRFLFASLFFPTPCFPLWIYHDELNPLDKDEWKFCIIAISKQSLVPNMKRILRTQVFESHFLILECLSVFCTYINIQNPRNAIKRQTLSVGNCSVRRARKELLVTRVPRKVCWNVLAQSYEEKLDTCETDCVWDRPYQTEFIIVCVLMNGYEIRAAGT